MEWRFPGPNRRQTKRGASTEKSRIKTLQSKQISWVNRQMRVRRAGWRARSLKLSRLLPWKSYLLAKRTCHIALFCLHICALFYEKTGKRASGLFQKTNAAELFHWKIQNENIANKTNLVSACSYAYVQGWVAYSSLEIAFTSAPFSTRNWQTTNTNWPLAEESRGLQ